MAEKLAEFIWGKNLIRTRKHFEFLLSLFGAQILEMVRLNVHL